MPMHPEVAKAQVVLKDRDYVINIDGLGKGRLVFTKLIGDSEAAWCLNNCWAKPDRIGLATRMVQQFVHDVGVGQNVIVPIWHGPSMSFIYQWGLAKQVEIQGPIEIHDVNQLAILPVCQLLIRSGIYPYKMKIRYQCDDVVVYPNVKVFGITQELKNI